MIDRVFKTTTVLAVAASLLAAGSSMAVAKDNFNPKAKLNVGQVSSGKSVPSTGSCAIVDPKTNKPVVRARTHRITPVIKGQKAPNPPIHWIYVTADTSRLITYNGVKNVRLIPLRAAHGFNGLSNPKVWENAVKRLGYKNKVAKGWYLNGYYDRVVTTERQPFFYQAWIVQQPGKRSHFVHCYLKPVK